VRRVKHKSNGISPVAAMVFIAFIIVAILCCTRLYDIKTRGDRLSAENQQLIAQRDALKVKNQELQAQNLRGRDEAYVENIARSQLDMVYPGEIIFRTTGE